jgi:pimeloyl-ACP methyl ester carboxylesterase
MSGWILLRGLTREQRHWGDFVARMGRAHPGDTVAALDLPGNGRRNQLDSPRSVASMVDDCRQQLQARDEDPPYRLLAMSLGAMVAIDWASRFPAEVDGAVLVNTSLGGASPFYHRLRPGNYWPLINSVLRGASDEQWERMILALTSRHPPDPETLLASWVQFRREYPVSRANALRQLLAASRFSLPPAAPSCPLLLLAASRDALVNADCSRALAARWRCAIDWHPSAGHDIPLDDPDWVVAKTCNFPNS